MRPTWGVHPKPANLAAGPFGQFCAADSGLLGEALILTLDGERPIAELSTGDRLITRDSGVAKVRHIQTHRRPCHLITLPSDVFGVAAPGTQTTVAAEQMVLLRGARARAYFDCATALVEAKALLGEPGVTDRGRCDAVVHQIFCDAPHILYCDGLEVSTADGARARGAVLEPA